MDCPEWVKIVESRSENKTESFNIIKNNLDTMLKNKPDKIVLGCTHYPFLLPVLSKFAPQKLFIDPAVDFARFIKNDLENNDLLNTDANYEFEKFYVSADPENFRRAGSVFYDIKELPKLVD